jgi:putative transposase
LTKDGLSVGENTVGRIMRGHGIRPWYSKPFRRPKRDKERRDVRLNNLDREFETGEANLAWLADITEFLLAEEKLYLSVVEDLGTRRVIGWSMSHGMRVELVEKSLQMAIKARGKPVKVLFHSDQEASSAANSCEARWGISGRNKACPAGVTAGTTPRWNRFSPL